MDPDPQAASPPLWTPPGERTRASGLADFAAWVAERGLGRGHDLDHVAAELAGERATRPQAVALRAAEDPGPSRDARGPGSRRDPDPGPDTPRRAYDRLWRWSISEQEEFWGAVWEWSGIAGERGDRVLVDGDRMPGARYFPDARLNFAENLLRPEVVRRRANEPAIIAWGEDGARRTVTWQELHDLVSRLQQAMRAAGIGPGDRVAAMLPNAPEAVAVMLAAASVGAVLSTASPDFGPQGVIDRFAQVAPRLFFVVEGYAYRGRRHDVLARVPAMLEGLPSVERLVVAGAGEPRSSGEDRPGEDVPASTVRRPSGMSAVVRAADPAAAIAGVRTQSWSDFIRPYDPEPVAFVRLPFDHPLWILFSSGTTGVPKCIVHRAGGVLLQHVKEHRLHCDVRAGDRVFYFTTLGWMMWNWLVSALASEAAILLWDGSPVHPRESALFDFADGAGMTLMGVSPGYLGALRSSGFRPCETHDLSSLRTLLCTGSPVPPAAFEYACDGIRRDMLTASISGGTDLCACFVGTVPGLPVRAGEIQAPVLGMAVDVFGPDGASLEGAGRAGDGPAGGASSEAGERLAGDGPVRDSGPAGPGELVCTRPFPSLPLGFLGDAGGERYRKAYFARFPGVWRHGDWMERTASGGYVIHGRSDATLNVRGVRIGTAEIYRPVEAMAEVAEAVAVAQRWGDDTRMVLFVRLRKAAEGGDGGGEAGAGGGDGGGEAVAGGDAATDASAGTASHARLPRLDAALRDRIRHVLRTQASPRHVPAKIIQVSDIPRTRSGKVVELAVRAVVRGEPVANVEALANPEALEEFRGRV